MLCSPEGCRAVGSAGTVRFCTLSCSLFSGGTSSGDQKVIENLRTEGAI